MGLPRTLSAERGVVCAVGAGGKKTTLFTLARRIDRAVVTSTVRIPIFDTRVERVVVTTDPCSAVRAADDWPLGVVPGREHEDRYGGYDPDVIDEIARAAPGTVLVKADGARTRELKAPGEREPQLPRRADTVIPVASVRAVGRPLDASTVHRPERVAAIADREPGERIEPEDVAKVLASDRGGCKAVPEGATVVPVLNKVDDPDRERVAREVAEGILARADVPRVVLARMTAREPVVAVVTR